MKSWKHWALLALVAVALALGLMRALGKREQQQQAAQQVATQARTPAELELSTRDLYAAEQAELVRTLPFTGTLKAVRSATVKARVAGELRELELREGDPVRAGQLLARIDATEALARMQQAEQQALASEAQLAIAQRQFDNNQALVDQGFISKTALDTSASQPAGRPGQSPGGAGGGGPGAQGAVGHGAAGADQRAWCRSGWRSRASGCRSTPASSRSST
jgi:multidrug efflux pump subunit AcrA (membrane-fusion protein)